MPAHSPRGQHITPHAVEISCNHLHRSRSSASEASTILSVLTRRDGYLVLHGEVVVSLDSLHSRLATCLVHMGDVSRHGQQLIIAITAIHSAPDSAVEVE